MKNILKVTFYMLFVFSSVLILSACTNSNKHTHYFNQKIASVDYLVNSATCIDSATYFYSCKCGEKSDKVFEYGESLGHSFINYTYNNDASCDVDGTKTAICERVNCDRTHTQIALNTALEHEFTNYILYSSATCLEDETQIATCDRINCNKSNIITIENTATGHNYGDWTPTGTGWHEKVCKNNPLHQIGGTCSGGTATCKNKALCSTCFGEYGQLRDYHLFSNTWTTTESHHWKESTCECELKDQYEEHILDEDSGFCKKCDYMLQPSSGIVYKLSANGEYAEVEKYEGSSSKVNIADTYLDVPVKVIGPNAFNQTNISLIIIPNTIEEIADKAFYNCDNLTTINLGNASKLTKIGKESFYGCNYLKSFDIPNTVKEIGNHAFAYCEKITSFIVPDSVELIGWGAFECCHKLETITVPFVGASLNNNEAIHEPYFNYIFGGLYYTDELVLPSSLKNVIITGGTKIYDNAFCDCSKLEVIKLPNTINYIGKSAFFGCSNLKEVNIPEGILEIGNSTFYGCSNLISVTIPSSVTYLGNYIFQYCARIAIKFNGTIEQWKNVGKDAYWNDFPYIKTIECIDGVVNL